MHSPISPSRHAASLCSLALLCALFGQTSAAQTAVAPAADTVANPSATVPAVNYRSVFKETSLGVEKESTDWRKANETVGKFTRGHVDILKSEEMDSAKTMQDSMDKPMDKAKAAPEPMQKPAVPPKPDTTKPIAAPAHQH